MILVAVTKSIGLALPSEGKGHTFESCRVRQSCRRIPTGIYVSIETIAWIWSEADATSPS